VTGRIFDPGLQPERTDLAWRRTAIAIVLGAIVSLRLLPLVLGPWALGLGFLALLAAGALWVLVLRRAGAVGRALVDGTGDLPDGALPLALALAASGGGLFGILYVLVR
jgi:uncharacterized membrane protein YidH (DUF202 family)